MSINIEEKLKNIDAADTFIRIDSIHLLDLYIGKDINFRNTLLLIANEEPSALRSSILIDANMGQREDNSWVLSFSLTDPNFSDVFSQFCYDLIESSRSIKNPKQGVSFITTRYEKWQKMLKEDKVPLLPQHEIKGLMGELYFLMDYLIPLYGESVAVNSWVGTENSPADFVCENLWYEVKATSSTSEKVSISSVEQLDSVKDGELAFVCLDKTSPTDIDGITIRILAERILTLIEEKYKVMILNKLLEKGYFLHEKYDSYIYKFVKLDRYSVKSDFPCIRRKNLEEPVLTVKYELSIIGIKNYLISE